MHNNPSFPFTFLQPTGGGNKTLTVPSVSASYQWTAQQVAKLATNRGSVYIKAIMSDLYLRDVDSEVSDFITFFYVLGFDFRRIQEQIQKPGTCNNVTLWLTMFIMVVCTIIDTIYIYTCI